MTETFDPEDLHNLASRKARNSAKHLQNGKQNFGKGRSGFQGRFEVIGIEEMNNRLTTFVGRLLCLLGIHDFKIIETRLSFGSAGGVSMFQCEHCGKIVTRPN